MNQKDKVLRHIQNKGYITSWEAITKYRITRLSAKVFDLKQDGIEIKTKIFVNPETKTNYGVYYIQDKEIKKYEKKFRNNGGRV